MGEESSDSGGSSGGDLENRREVCVYELPCLVLVVLLNSLLSLFRYRLSQVAHLEYFERTIVYVLF